MIKLYRGPLSTNVERVALALAHKGLEVESIEIDWDDRSPVEAVSGQSLVPVIQDDGGDGEVVYDSATILRYLEERYPEPPLFPSDPARRAEMDVFIDWFNEVWKYSPNRIEEELEKGSPDAAVIERHSALMVERMGLFERLLDGRDYIMGYDVTAADFVAFPFLKYALFPKLPEDDEPFHQVLDDLPASGRRPSPAPGLDRAHRCAAAGLASSGCARSPRLGYRRWANGRGDRGRPLRWLGAGDDSDEAEVPGGADPDATRVIEDWATALREGDVEAAAEYFELPSVAQNGTPPLELDSRRDVILFNRALPCGAELIRAEEDGRFTVATFELTERPGPGECGDGVGNEAKTAFVIEDGLITEWIRAADEPLTEPPAEGPVV